MIILTQSFLFPGRNEQCKLSTPPLSQNTNTWHTQARARTNTWHTQAHARTHTWHRHAHAVTDYTSLFPISTTTATSNATSSDYVPTHKHWQSLTVSIHFSLPSLRQRLQRAMPLPLTMSQHTHANTVTDCIYYTSLFPCSLRQRLKRTMQLPQTMSQHTNTDTVTDNTSLFPISTTTEANKTHTLT